MEILMALQVKPGENGSKAPNYLFLAFGRQPNPEKAEGVVVVAYFIYSREDAARIRQEFLEELPSEDDKDLSEILEQFEDLPQTSEVKPFVYFGGEALQMVRLHHYLSSLEEKILELESGEKRGEKVSTFLN